MVIFGMQRVMIMNDAPCNSLQRIINFIILPQQPIYLLSDGLFQSILAQDSEAVDPKKHGARQKLLPTHFLEVPWRVQVQGVPTKRALDLTGSVVNHQRGVWLAESELVRVDSALDLVCVHEHEKNAKCGQRDATDGDGQWAELGLGLRRGGMVLHGLLDKVVEDRVLGEHSTVCPQAYTSIALVASENKLCFHRMDVAKKPQKHVAGLVGTHVFGRFGCWIRLFGFGHMEETFQLARSRYHNVESILVALLESLAAGVD